MIWEKVPLDQAKVRKIAERYGINLLTASILARRGIEDPEDMMFYLETDLRFLHNPFLFVEMEDAVDRILAAKEEGEKVLIFGDRDVDGITSIALLVRTLKAMGIHVSWRLPMGDEPYGLTLEAVEEFAAQDGTLIITVDCGISNVREIERALELGVDTIIVDHHNPPDEIPRACAVINPKVEDSGYPFRDLAGCGVAVKLVWALRFAETDFYNEPLTLLNVRPGNGTYILEAVRMQNLVVLDSIEESLVPGIVSVEGSRLMKFFGGRIFVYGVKTQEQMLRKIFTRAEISLLDIEPEITKVFPAIRGKSLLRLRETSRLGLFRDNPVSELDIFVDLFTSWVIKKTPKLSDAYASLFDLVALGTLADMMPVRNENRIIIRAGMEILNSVKPRDGVRELMRLQDLLGKPVTSRDVAWQINPSINAAGRMGEPDRAVKLLLSDNPQERETLAKTITGLNEQRKKIVDDMWEVILPDARESLDKNDSKFVLVCDPRIHRGITGLLAQRLVKFFDVPSAACAVLDSKVIGSLRSTRGYAALPFLEKCSDILREYGGHDFAAGFNFAPDDVSRFRQRLEQLLPEITLNEKGEERIIIDAELPPNYLKPDMEELLNFFAPHGESNPVLTFMTPGVVVEDLAFIGKDQLHTRLLVRAGEYAWPAVFWNSAERVGRDFNKNDKVNLLYQLEKNYFQNKETLRLSIVDIKRCV
ncbi:MAG: single-stranded-DNA-specific exonuclease RecJ [Spirochaetales bacterium]|jgi:single-stranded-DNA-specific exonuclease|nr:single-stranded-DNA-specific exonuclease RecJ [Spirochaetales bacterium]